MLIHLLRHCGLTVNALDDALTYRSGLFGVSGVSSDLAQIETAASQGHERAQLAFDMFADRVRSAIGALAVTVGGLDALVFTDRIGENSPAMRAAVCDGLECLDVRSGPAAQCDLPSRQRHCGRCFHGADSGYPHARGTDDCP